MAKKQKKNKSNKLSSNRLNTKRVKPLSDSLNKVLAQAYQLHQSGRLQEASIGYRKVLEERADSHDANFLYGVLLVSVSQPRIAITHFRQALSQQPKERKYYSALGETLCSIGEYEEAESVLEIGIKVAPSDFVCLHNYGVSLINQKKYAKAEAVFTKAISIQPTHAPSLNNMGNALVGLWQVDKANDYFKKAFECDPSFLFSASNLLLNLNYSDQLSEQDLSVYHQEYGKRFPSEEPLKFLRSSGSKIRIGFVSGDFYTHAVAMFFLPLAEGLSKDKFEVHLYHNSQLVDSMTKTLKEASFGFHDVAALSDAQFVEKVRNDNLDIVFDLSGHTNKNRLQALSKRVAPIQINWLGYPNITGIPSMDYRLVDKITDPESEAHGTDLEKLIRLPECFLCYRGDRTIDLPDSVPFKTNEYITFGSFNNLLKVTLKVIEIWSQILLKVPQSKLLLKAKQLGEPEVKNRLVRDFERFGIDPDRLDLRANLPAASDHMKLYHEIDIALDTFPYNGTTTTCEALWMGVPVISVSGDRHAARVGESLLIHSGTQGYLASDLDHYVELAAELASKPEEIEAHRKNLRAQVAASSLGSEESFVRSFEDLMTELISNHSHS